MELYDLVVIGGGPAGLSAAINGASELPKVMLFDSGKKDTTTGGFERQLGGQAIGSTSIENYAGFLDVSGCDLMKRFEEQAIKLGTHIKCPEHVCGIEIMDDSTKRITTREGSVVLAKAVIIACGLSYRKLPAPGVEALIGKGVLYGAPTSNPRDLGACTVCIVGGANSAGQAIMHLSQNPDLRIKVLVRNPNGIELEMSQYLVDRIHACHNVEVISGCSVTEAIGEDKLSAVQVRHADGNEVSLDTDHLFIFIGAVPKTEWLAGKVAVDPRGFIFTGEELGAIHGKKFPFETSMTGVFAAGDIRSGSVKRVAAGVGEGAQAVHWMHRYFADKK